LAEVVIGGYMDLMAWLKDNQSWFFSGAGVPILLGLGWIVKRLFDRDNSKQKQSSGKNSINIQSSGDIDLTNSSIKNDTRK
jgi:hypothetical protein